MLTFGLYGENRQPSCSCNGQIAIENDLSGATDGDCEEGSRGAVEGPQGETAGFQSKTLDLAAREGAMTGGRAS